MSLVTVRGMLNFLSMIVDLSACVYDFSVVVLISDEVALSQPCLTELFEIMFFVLSGEAATTHEATEHLKCN